jgi:hypothetical protein
MTEKPDDRFFDRADEIIRLVNEQVKTENGFDVCNSLIFAASRFSAYVISVMSKNSEDIIKNKDENIKNFTNKFEQSLTHNLNDFIENYEKHLKKS